MKRRISLNGTWDFVPDLDPTYHADTRPYPFPPLAHPDADRRHWQPVAVPGVWQKYGERYSIFEGVCWFAREFDIDDLPDGAAAYLRFAGVNYLCRVFLNGAEVGSHEGGYTEFIMCVSDQLKAGTNHIAVAVDNRATTIKWPPVLGYFNYGGIHRDVTLEVTTGPCFDEVRISAVPAQGGGEIEVSGGVSDAGDDCVIRARCAGVTGEGAVGPDGSFLIRLHCQGVQSWAPEHPRLYSVALSLISSGEVLDDEEKHRCGFRMIDMKRGRIHLNGESRFLKGICYVYDSPIHGLVMHEEQLATDIALIKDLGCNALRCHYPMDERFYTACDRAGILVWIEPPIYCLHPADDETGTPFADPRWQSLAEQMITEMILSARNHPCVAIYGIGNECNAANPEARTFFNALAASARAADSTRLISYAALYGLVGPLASAVDVLGMNSYWGWYDKIFGGKGLEPEKSTQPDRSSADICGEPIDLGPMREMLDQVLSGQGDLAVLLTEFGADSVAGCHSASRDLWSEEYHADLLREVFALVGEYQQIVGTFPFAFSDYRDPSKVPNGYWNEYNLKGVVDYHRKPKLAFTALQEAYRGRSSIPG